MPTQTKPARIGKTRDKPATSSSCSSQLDRRAEVVENTAFPGQTIKASDEALDGPPANLLTHLPHPHIGFIKPIERLIGGLNPCTS